MEKQQFKNFCKAEFQKRGFRKIKKAYYLPGKELLCGLDLQKSNFANDYYINYFYCIGDYHEGSSYPDYYSSDIDGRIIVMSKTMTYQGSHFLTDQIEYEEYTEDELREYFEKAFDDIILPPLSHGKKYILDNLGKLYSLTLNQEEVLRKLQD